MLKFVSFEIPPKHHLQISLIFGAWTYLFLILIGPFDVFTLDIDWRIRAMIPYGLIIIVSYLISVPIQNWLYAKQKIWNGAKELFFISFFFLVCFIPTYFYYTSPYILGEYSLLSFIFKIYLPTVILLTPLLVSLRFYNWRKRVQQAPTGVGQILIQGLNKSDVLRVEFQSLVCIKSADNYIEVFYLNQNRLEKRVMRLTLKKAHELIPDLLRTHRSYLVNISHFVAWNGANSLQLSTLSIPVSESYKSKITNIVNEFAKKDAGFATITSS